MSNPALPLILLSVFLNAFAQSLLKKGLSGVALSSVRDFVSLLQSLWIWGGLISYGISLLVWVKALSLVQINYAYPFLALGFVINALLAYMFFGEMLSPLRWLALFFIVVGIVLQAYSGR